MFKNYMSVMLRSLRKNGIYSVINIAGLSIGITCSILILLWVFDELTYNHFLPKHDRIYKVMANVTYDGKINTWGAVALPAYEALKTEDSKIVNTCVAGWGNDFLLTVGEKKIRKRGQYVSEEFLTMFEYGMVKGNARQVLADMSGIVLTESTARALFGNEDPINKVVRVDDKYDQKVTGVVRDVPASSSMQFSCLMPWKLNETTEWVKNAKNNWGNYSFGVYVELDSKTSQGAVEKVISSVPSRHEKTDVKRVFFLYPLDQWRLYSQFENGLPKASGMVYVQLFSVIAIFILLIACINFMNLATARSERRAKEVGIRKSVGSGRKELIFQFMGESLFIALIAFIISVVLAQLLLPFYNNLVQKKLFIDYTSSPFWIFAAVLVFFTGILSGSYPALYLSSFKPVKVLKGKIQTGKRGSTPRQVLVTLQFGVAILLIIGMLVVYKQIQYVKKRDIGYDKEGLITINYTDDIRKHYGAIKHELLQTGAVSAVTKANNAVTEINSWSFLGWPGKLENQKVMFGSLATEYDYSKTTGIKVLMGRDFSEDFKSDSSAIIINKAALDVMGLKDPIGQKLSYDNGQKRELVGVIDNTIMGSPDEMTVPVFITLAPDWASVMLVRLEKTDDMQASLQKVEEVFKKYSPAYPFEYTFVDEEYQKKFTDINLVGKLANLFASLAIVITGLGLFGLASFMAEQRTKEIGIRKVLGASVYNVVTLMTKDFSRLVALAFVISAPLSWWLLQKFLARYEYRITMPWWIFPLTGIIALLFALVVVSTQSVRAASANPVNSLRSE